jgi:hypothetical protein
MTEGTNSRGQIYTSLTTIRSDRLPCARRSIHPSELRVASLRLGCEILTERLKLRPRGFATGPCCIKCPGEAGFLGASVCVASHGHLCAQPILILPTRITCPARVRSTSMDATNNAGSVRSKLEDVSDTTGKVFANRRNLHRARKWGPRLASIESTTQDILTSWDRGLLGRGESIASCDHAVI